MAWNGEKVDQKMFQLFLPPAPHLTILQSILIKTPNERNVDEDLRNWSEAVFLDTLYHHKNVLLQSYHTALAKCSLQSYSHNLAKCSLTILSPGLGKMFSDQPNCLLGWTWFIRIISRIKTLLINMKLDQNTKFAIIYFCLQVAHIINKITGNIPSHI